jgi:UDP-glucuronate 4-epimerase
MSETILVTGAAGFIGFHVAKRLLEVGRRVVSIDNLNDYYDPGLKRDRILQLRNYPAFRFEVLDLADRTGVARLFSAEHFPYVIHLAAQPGVRYSLLNPNAYVDSNLVGFVNILEGCRHGGCRHLVYASSSSVYGANSRLPFRTRDTVDHPISLYAATKKANELMAHAYAHLFGLPSTGLRFFTVYGPWGRPDMAVWLFAKAILAGEPIKLFNNGCIRRDFTYVDDVVESVVRLIEHVPTGDPAWSGDAPDPATSYAPWRVYNIGNSQPIELMRLVELLEAAVGRPAIKRFEPMQPGDVPATLADVDDLAAAVDFQPRTSIEEGIARFVTWYRAYYKL